MCRVAQKEALESAAKMLREVSAVDKSFFGNHLDYAADLVRSHRPWEKPAPQRPKVSRKAVEEAVASSEGPRPIPGSPMFNRLMEVLSRVLDLED